MSEEYHNILRVIRNRYQNATTPEQQRAMATLTLQANNTTPTPKQQASITRANQIMANLRTTNRPLYGRWQHRQAIDQGAPIREQRRQTQQQLDVEPQGETYDSIVSLFTWADRAYNKREQRRQTQEQLDVEPLGETYDCIVSLFTLAERAYNKRETNRKWYKNMIPEHKERLLSNKRSANKHYRSLHPDKERERKRIYMARPEVKEHNKQYYQKNKEARKIHSKEYRKANKERYKERRRQWYRNLTNEEKAKLNEARQLHRTKNHERELYRQRKYNARPEVKEKSKRYYQEHRERILERAKQRNERRKEIETTID